ncbi:hypothetical protein OA856_00905 [Pelagibacteraceae bacterium]|nr:hypothetical protein [Pelagibacteraceae bacterium]
MKDTDIKLPSNKKFGFFFMIVFCISAVIFFKSNFLILGYLFLFLSVLLLLIILIKVDTLLPFNRLWMRFGFLLGMIMQPIILALLFFILFTPIAFLFRIIRRDELRLKLVKKNTYWIKRDRSRHSNSFKNQF